jgi:hypothetical protein
MRRGQQRRSNEYDDYHDYHDYHDYLFVERGAGAAGTATTRGSDWWCRTWRRRSRWHHRWRRT